jgi:hypothetical protein
MTAWWCAAVAWAEPEASTEPEASIEAEALVMAASVQGREDEGDDAVVDGDEAPEVAAPSDVWTVPPLEPPPPSPLPWVVAGIGGSLAAVGVAMAAPGWDPARPAAADGARTAVAGATVGVGGVVWGVVQRAARSRR